MLVGTNLYQVDLRDAVLGGPWPSRTTCGGTDLTRADLTASHLRKARMDFAGLRGANLADADLTGVSLRGALADNDTTWPDGFDPAAAGVTSRPDAPPIRPVTTSRPWHGRTTPDRIERSPRLRSAIG